MKVYWILPLMMLFGISCDDDTSPIAAEDYDEIVFGVSGQDISSRTINGAHTPDTFRLYPDGECSDLEPIPVYITVTDINDAETTSRSTPVKEPEELKSFGIYSFYHTDPSSAPKSFFINETASNNGNCWMTGTPYYWPTTPGSSLSFWAMAGIDAQGVSITRSSDSTEGMEINYTVPQRANDQTDLLLATTGKLNTPGQRVPLQFKHLCGAVKFVIGTEMQPGTIKNIALSGIKSQGKYTTTWENLSGSATFPIAIDKPTDGNTVPGTPVTPDYNTLMMIPQTLGEEAMLTVVFQDNVTGTERKLTAPLKGQTWRQGKTTTYHIGITPGFKIEFTNEVEPQDAHYVICNSAIRVSGLPADKRWTITAKASDNSDPTIQFTADVNEFVKQGFWTDKEMLNGTTKTNRWARGTSVVEGTGSGEFPLTVFLPENASDANRTVTLTLSVDGAPAKYAVTQEISQLPPHWVGNEGWEQIDDNQNGAYGFSYTAHHVYVYYDGNYQIGNTLSLIKSMIDKIIAQYNASDYVDIYYKSYAAKYRYALDINYEKLSNLGLNASSGSNGLNNTRQLFNFGGSAVSNTFEEALVELKRVGDETITAFRKRSTSTAWNDIDNRFGFPKWVEGTAINESQALSIVLKKNRYYLNRYTDSGTGMESTAPRITEDNIVWYLPAYEQFSNLPAGSYAPNDFWSSTAYDNATQAYLGNGTPASRTTQKRIRVMRNR